MNQDDNWLITIYHLPSQIIYLATGWFLLMTLQIYFDVVRRSHSRGQSINQSILNEITCKELCLNSNNHFKLLQLFYASIVSSISDQFWVCCSCQTVFFVILAICKTFLYKYSLYIQTSEKGTTVTPSSVPASVRRTFRKGSA